MEERTNLPTIPSSSEQASSANIAEMAQKSVKNPKNEWINKITSHGSFRGLKQSEIGTYLGVIKDRVQAVLPSHLNADKILQMAASTIYSNQKIAQCSIPSLLGAVVQASMLGFPAVSTLGYCYFVPYGNEVQFQIGYRGLVDLARRSGKIKSIYAEVVREGDDFQAELGLYPVLIHKPKFDVNQPITHVYAVAHFTDGGHQSVILSKSDVERLRLRSPMQKGEPAGVWKSDYDAMAKAKALKQLAKYLPLNIDQVVDISTDQQVVQLTDQGLEMGEFQDAEVVG